MHKKTILNTLVADRFFAFFAQWYNASGKKQADVAQLLDITQSGLSAYMQKKQALSIVSMEVFASNIGIDLLELLAQGRAILTGEEPGQIKVGADVEGIALEDVKAMTAFKIVLQNQHDSAAKLIKENVMNYATKNEFPSEAQDPTTKRRSA